MLEYSVTDSQGFVDDQNVGFNARRDRKRQAHVHAAGVSLDRLMNEVADFGKAFDLREERVSFATRKAQQGRVHIDVFDAGKFGIEAGAQFEQCRYPAFVPNLSLRWLERAGDDLQQRRLAAAVGTDDADDVAFVQFERDLVQCPELFVPPQTSARQRL